jgi:hypothetical protein
MLHVRDALFAMQHLRGPLREKSDPVRRIPEQFVVIEYGMAGKPLRLRSQATHLRKKAKSIPGGTPVRDVSPPSERTDALPTNVIANAVSTEVLKEFKGTYWSRHYKRCLRQLFGDRGGRNNCSAAQTILIKHSAALETECWLKLQRLARTAEGGSDKEIEGYQRMINTLRRCLEDLGLQRTPKQIPTAMPVIEGVAIEDKPDPVRLEVERRAFQEGNDALLGALFRSNEQQKTRDDEDPPMRVYEVS